MTINIQFLHMPTSEYMYEFIAQRFRKLAKKYPRIIEANATIKKENETGAEGKICEIQLRVPGSAIFAKVNTFEYETAVIKAIKEVETQLKKRKEILLKH